MPRTQELRRRLLRPVVARLMPGALAGATRPLTVPGTTITGFDEGQGPPLLLVHPGSATADAWAGVASSLTDRFRVLAHDRPTYRAIPAGLRPPPSGMAAEVAEVLALADFAGDRPLLVGHSSGGVVALEAARTAPTSFRGLVLYEPPVAVDAPLGGAALTRARAAIDADDPSRAMAVFLREIVGTAPLAVSAMRAIPPLWRSQCRHAAAQIADTEAIESLGVGLDRYRALAVPTLLLTGDRSPAHLRARVDALSTALPVSATVTLRGQGHLATLRAPRLVAETIAEFADRLG